MILFLCKILYHMLRTLLLIIMGVGALFIVYPLGVIVPFLWNFRWNPKGWVFTEFYYNDSSDTSWVFFANKDVKWQIIYERYPTYFHFLYAVLFYDTSTRDKRIGILQAHAVTLVGEMPDDIDIDVEG